MKSLLLVCLLLFAQSQSEISLRSLSDVSSKKIKVAGEESRLFILFQKDCQACREQISDLKCLPPEVEVMLIGSFSSEKDLRREYRSFASPFSGYYGDRQFRTAFGIKEELTPQIILSGRANKEVIMGKIPCLKILEKLQRKG